MKSKAVLCGSLLAALLALSACAPAGFNSAANEAATDSSTGIIGGQDLQVFHPLAKSIVGLIVPISSNKSANCTGTLLANNLILTAAHCIMKDTRRMMVIFSTDMQRTSMQTVRSVDLVAVNPMWGKNEALGRNFGDIALVHYAGTTPPGYQPASILPATSMNLLRPGTQTVLAGYGWNNGVAKTGGGILRATTVTVADPRFSETEVRLDQSQGHGACHGDSGGPAIIYIGTQPFVWGVTHGGIDQADEFCTAKVLYTAAPAYADWIKRVSDALVRQAPAGGAPVALR